MFYGNDKQMKKMLAEAKVVAVVGHSARPYRTSYRIAQYLRNVGYKVYPVNPTVKKIDGEKSYPDLQSLPEKADIVDVFRRSIFVPDVISNAIEAESKNVWTQLGVYHEEAGEQAQENGMGVVMDRCIMVEHRRLIR